MLPVTLVEKAFCGMNLSEDIFSRNWLILVVFGYFIELKLKSPASILDFFSLNLI